MSRSKMPHRRYTDEFKTEAVKLAQEVGVTEAARRLDMPMTSIQNWMKSGLRANAERWQESDGRAGRTLKAASRGCVVEGR